MPKRVSVPSVKTDAERGPFGAWAFHARDALNLSVEEVASRLGYHPASLRKVESGSAPASRRLVRELPALYGDLATEKRLTLPPAPAEQEPPESDVAVALRELVEEVRLSRLASERSAEVLAELLGVVVQGRLPQQEIATEVAAQGHRGNGQ